MSELFIPRKTQEKLAQTHPKGDRHKAALDLAISLIGNGFDPGAVFAQLRAKFDPEKSDKELHDIVSYAVGLNPSPSGYGSAPASRAPYRPQVAKPLPAPKVKTPAEQAAWWLTGMEMTQEQFAALSQLALPEGRRDALRFFLEMLYLGADNLNIVCKYGERAGKAHPEGPGRILSRDKWIEYFEESGVPDSKAGAWFRPNPVQAQGSGAAGAPTDADVTSHRFLLLESDKLPLPIQFALFSKLKLPIAAAYLSGGVSVHALVRLDADSAEVFEKRARRIMAVLEPFGIDQCNKNPSRLSRLPGARRVIGAAGDGFQTLLWLNPGKPAATDKDLSELEDSMLIPAIEERPFRRVIMDSIDRYEDMMKNQGKLGVPTGFARFDRVSGGLKPGGYTLVAAATGVGKSTIAVNMINSALQAGNGVVLFTLEMSRDDIADMMFSMNCRIDRNLFNTGAFSEDDIKRMTTGAGRMQDLPFYLDDDPDAGIETIRRRVLSLKADNRIGLAVVDYAQLVQPESQYDGREQAVASVALALRLLSRQANIPIIVLSQLNDEGRVRESRKLTHEAATVFRMTRENLTDSKIVLHIDKGRKIPANPIDLFLKAEHCLITEASPIAAEDYQRGSRG